MAKNSTTQESLIIALELLKRIPKSGAIQASELHQQLQQLGIERDKRSIYRILDTLCEHFNGLICDKRSKPYGYRWDKNAAPVFFNAQLQPQEALLLSLAEQYLTNLLPANVTGSLESFFNQAKQQLMLNFTGG